MFIETGFAHQCFKVAASGRGLEEDQEERLPLAVMMSWSEAIGQADHNLASGKVFKKY